MQRPFLKQFADLTADDFVTHPGWVGIHTMDVDEPWFEEAEDETDEETFRPWTGPLPVDPAEQLAIKGPT